MLAISEKKKDESYKKKEENRIIFHMQIIKTKTDTLTLRK